ncbi:ABC transporter substrate-binding protein [Paenibacillus chungangensis]|uniref:ABC transporter substrate-binding protein n=1 Tax=Paenibacillus chungangensis TaxID=696535 RepID=A0ABW3HX15_9BACL
MKKKMVTVLTFLLCLSLLAAACSGKGGDEAGNGKSNEGQKANSDLKGELTLWSFQGEQHKPIIAAFQRKYPNIKLNFSEVEDSHNKLLVAVAAGTGAPDVAWINENHYGNNKALEGLENLLEEPYNAGQYKDQFNEYAWNAGVNMKGELVGFPLFMNPYVTFYRQDIIEAAGYPSEPEEFGEFIRDEDNLFELVAAVRAQNPEAVFFRHTRELSWMLNTVGFYNHELEYQRNNDHWVRVIDITKRALSTGALPSIEGVDTNQLMANGNLVLYFNPSSAIDGLIKYGPDFKGLWRTTTVPFVEKTPGRGYTQLVIPSQSKNKEAAWAFVKFVSMDPEGAELMSKSQNIVMAYKPVKDLPFVESEGHEFFGGQLMHKFNYSLVDEMEFPIGSPLESAAQKVWQEGIDEGVTKNMDSRALMTQLMERIEAEVQQQKQELLGK